MRAVCWNGKYDVRVEHVPDPILLNPRDAILRVTSTAICGSDLHLYDGVVPSMVPGDIMLLLMLIPSMLTALAVVREKELGSIANFYAAPATRATHGAGFVPGQPGWARVSEA